MQQRGRVGLLLRQGVAADDPAEIAAQALGIQQRRDEALRLVGDDRQLDPLRAQPVEGCQHARINPGQAVVIGIGLHEQFERLLGVGRVDMLVLQTAGQGAAHQHPRAIADPVAHPLDPGRRLAELEQALVHRRGQVRHRIDQGAVQVEHHQARQLALKQFMQHAHPRTWASSARMASITLL
ncbi:hypothetical protein D3C72_1822970 [compost metagenome]